jgi:hypothetical protein
MSSRKCQPFHLDMADVHLASIALKMMCEVEDLFCWIVLDVLCDLCQDLIHFKRFRHEIISPSRPRGLLGIGMG